MLCVLSVKYRKNNLFERLFGKFLRDKYELTTVPVLKGAPFFNLTATVGKRGVDFERIIFEVGRCAENLLIDGEENIPKIKGIGEFKSDLLYNMLKDNTFELLKEKIGDIEFSDKENGIIVYNGNTIKIGDDRNDFNLPDVYLSIKPEKVEKYRFAAALYELCGVFSLGSTHFNSVLVNGEKKSLENYDFIWEK